MTEEWLGANPLFLANDVNVANACAGYTAVPKPVSVFPRALGGSAGLRKRFSK
jgi:hypothetical protein